VSPLIRVDIPAAEAVAYPDLLWQIHDRTVDVAVLRGFMDPEVMAAANAALAHDASAFPRTASEDVDLSANHVHVLGMTVTPSRVEGSIPYLEQYLASAGPFRAACARIFPPGDGFMERIQRLFEQLSGGRPATVYRDPDTDRPYTPATIRIVPPGCGMPLHSGLDFLSLEAYAQLRDVLDCSEQLSFFSPIARPEAGGALVVHHLDFHDDSRPLNEHGTLDNDTVLRTVSSEIVDLDPGDLVVFAGGRWYHRVSAVEGDQTRRTIGGFLGFTLDHSAIYYWS
jgi:hypothetical protein